MKSQIFIDVRQETENIFKLLTTGIFWTFFRTPKQILNILHSSAWPSCGLKERKDLRRELPKVSLFQFYAQLQTKAKPSNKSMNSFYSEISNISIKFKLKRSSNSSIKAGKQCKTSNRSTSGNQQYKEYILFSRAHIIRYSKRCCKFLFLITEIGLNLSWFDLNMLLIGKHFIKVGLTCINENHHTFGYRFIFTQFTRKIADYFYV